MSIETKNFRYDFCSWALAASITKSKNHSVLKKFH